jgi:cell division protease FtsH
MLVGHSAEQQSPGSAPCSDEMAARIDQEVGAILDEAYQLALSTLRQSRRSLESIAARLLDVETIRADELQTLMEDAQEASERPAAG